MNFFKSNIYTRWVILVFSLSILTLILWNTYLLFQTFKNEERVKMEIWAEAYKSVNSADGNTDLDLALSVLSKNETIPLILVDNNGQISEVRNVGDEILENKQLQAGLLRKFTSENDPIEIIHPGGSQFLYYGNSSLITKIKYYPLALIVILGLFGGLVYTYFRTSKMSAESKLWAGMAKETAHQIGTPLSSLLGWIEIMKLDNVDEQTVSEIGKDVSRLQTIADRFSKIGSEPVLEPLDIVEETEKSFQYLKSRSSTFIDFEFVSYLSHYILPLNPTLHSWTVENLVKNAIDAIKGKGKITVTISETEKNIQIWVSDTGKGIYKNQFKTIFEPGFTTKKRGWGLGLSLTKRIVEEYHNGKIKVEKSEIGQGTTFCVTYKKSL